jgi:hypothetical protein
MIDRFSRGVSFQPTALPLELLSAPETTLVATSDSPPSVDALQAANPIAKPSTLRMLVLLARDELQS